jgi:hypothetical protein
VVELLRGQRRLKRGAPEKVLKVQAVEAEVETSQDLEALLVLRWGNTWLLGSQRWLEST